MFNSKIGIGVIDALESEFNDHKANMVKAYENYISNTHKFIEIAKSATNSELNDVRIDNSTFYLEYSGDSIIDVAKITDRVGNLRLTQGSIEYGRDIIRIGKSEVEIQTEGGIRYYTDLTEGSDIVLTFYTSLGELEPVHNLFRSKAAKARTTICRLVLSFRSQFFHNRLHFCNQAKDLSTTHLFGNTTKVCNSFRFITSTVAPIVAFICVAKFSPV